MSFSPTVLAKIDHLSESLFTGLCDTVGSQELVAIRRKIVDILEAECGLFQKGVVRLSLIFSGSRREGFLFEESDIDVLCAMVDFRVLWDTSQCHFYRYCQGVLFTFDSSDSPPGYGLLKVLERQNTHLCYPYGFLVLKGEALCVSSSALKSYVCSCSPFYTEHGPCATGSLGSIDVDNAWGVISDFWPLAASSFVSRCTVWPKAHVLKEIITQGCHLVPIGHKLGHHEEDEWRISFSVAEQKLIYSMNHCEFLLYGLLKIFLKEVINKGSMEEDKLLCSYHMKTAVFWVLQHSCCPQNILKYFWSCFKLILKWVYEGVCPNFFIPENNMFLTSVYGSNQRRLFDKLHQIYEKGLLCLFESCSIKSYLMSSLTNEIPTGIIDESLLMRKLYFELETYELVSLACFKNCLEALSFVKRLTELRLSPIQSILIQKLTYSCYKHTAFLLLSEISDTNKSEYVKHKMINRALQLSLKLGNASDLLSYAMYHYNMTKYRDALSFIDMAKDMFANPHMMHKGYVDRDLFNAEVRGLSLRKVVRKTYVSSIILFNAVPYIYELELERVKNIQFPFGVLQIPPLVFLHMLAFLCYRHVDMEKAMTALDDLSILVHYDRDHFIFPSFRDISWEILGICQQLSGKLRDAEYSYRKSLTGASVNRIRNATELRIQSVISQRREMNSHA